MRLFIAARLSDEMRGALTGAQAAMRKSGVKGNYTPDNNLHLTLAFIGEYGAPDRVAEVIEGVEFSGFTLKLEGFGCFGDLWWAGLARSEELDAYVRRLRRALAGAGIPFDGKRNRWLDVKKAYNPDIVVFTTPYKDFPPDFFVYHFRDRLTCYVPYGYGSLNMSKVNYYDPQFFDSNK